MAVTGHLGMCKKANIAGERVPLGLKPIKLI